MPDPRTMLQGAVSKACPRLSAAAICSVPGLGTATRPDRHKSPQLTGRARQCPYLAHRRDMTSTVSNLRLPVLHGYEGRTVCHACWCVSECEILQKSTHAFWLQNSQHRPVGTDQVGLCLTCGLLDVHPLAVVHQQELVAARVASNSQAEHGTGTVDAHTSSRLQQGTQHDIVACQFGRPWQECMSQ